MRGKLNHSRITRVSIHNQQMTVAASAIAEMKTLGQRLWRVATHPQPLSLPNIISMRFRRLNLRLSYLTGVLRGPYSPEASRQRKPLRLMKIILLNTRLSSPRGLPCDFGKKGARFAICTSVSQQRSLRAQSAECSKVLECLLSDNCIWVSAALAYQPQSLQSFRVTAVADSTPRQAMEAVRTALIANRLSLGHPLQHGVSDRRP